MKFKILVYAVSLCTGANWLHYVSHFAMDLQAGLSRTPCACKKLKPERRVSRSLPYTLRAEPIQAPIWELEGGRPLFRCTHILITLLCGRLLEFHALLVRRQELWTPLCRFWHDEKRFKGDGQSSIAQRTLLQ